jgi:hypothetical protein
LQFLFFYWYNVFEKLKENNNMRHGNLTEEEKRQRRNEASRKCYLKRKAMLSNTEPMHAKNKSNKSSKIDYIRLAEKIVKKYIKTSNGIKPMLREISDILSNAYKSSDEKTIIKIERILSKNLGVKIICPINDKQEHSKILIQEFSKTLKTPIFRVEQMKLENKASEELLDGLELDDEIEASNNVEVPIDPNKIDNIDIENPNIDLDNNELSDEDNYNEDDYDDSDNDYDEDEDDYDEDDSDEDDYDDVPHNKRRRKYDSGTERDWESGRWEMFGELDAQGTFDD